jgi:hypothetical protein
MEELTHVPTRCSKLQNIDASNIQVVVHKNKKTGINVRCSHVDKLKDKKIETKEVDMKKVRYEVFKFGMSGFKPEKKEEVKVALAIKLGAKPPKNKGYNYKEYKLIKEKQLKEQLEQQKLLAVGKTKTGRPVAKGKKKFVNQKGKQSGILDPYGKAGKVNYTIPVYIILLLVAFRRYYSFYLGLSFVVLGTDCVCGLVRYNKHVGTSANVAERVG